MHVLLPDYLCTVILPAYLRAMPCGIQTRQPDPAAQFHNQAEGEEGQVGLQEPEASSKGGQQLLHCCGPR